MAPGDPEQTEDFDDGTVADVSKAKSPSPRDRELTEPHPADEVDEWGYESFPASDPPQH
jgi:hypothetical protein